MRTLNVELGERAYPIHIGRGLLSSDLLASVIRGRQVLVVTNDRIAPLYLEKVLFIILFVLLTDDQIFIQMTKPFSRLLSFHSTIRISANLYFMRLLGDCLWLSQS